MGQMDLRTPVLGTKFGTHRQLSCLIESHVAVITSCSDITV